MTRAVLFGFIFIAVQILGLIVFEDSLFRIFYGNDQTNNFSMKQRRALYAVNKIVNNREKKIAGNYIFGGSSAREFFFTDKTLSKDLGENIYNLATANERPIDSHRLIDNIKIKGSHVIYMLHPKVFLESNESTLVYAKYLYGESLKFPVESRATNNLIDKLTREKPSIRLRLLPELNVHSYLLKDFLLKKEALVKAKAFKYFWTDNTPIMQHYYRGSMPMGDLISKLDDFTRKNKNNFAINLKNNFVILQSIVDICKKNGLKLTLFDLPISDILKRRHSVYLDQYKQKLSAFLAHNPDVNHISFNYKQYQDNQRYFYDTVHLNYKGRKYFKPFMIGGLKNALSF